MEEASTLVALYTSRLGGDIQFRHHQLDPTLISRTGWIPHRYKTAEISMSQLVRSVFTANMMHIKDWSVALHTVIDG